MRWFLVGGLLWHLWVLPRGGYLGDEALSVCIGPWQLWTGRPLWNGFTHYVSYVWYTIAWGDPEHARVLGMVVLTASTAVLMRGLWRWQGRWAAWAGGIWLTVGSPYVAQGRFATEIGLSILPAVLCLWLCAVAPVWAGLLVGPAVLVYPGAGLACGALVACGIILGFVPWRAVGGVLVGLGLLVLVRWVIAGPFLLTHWEGRSLSAGAEWVGNLRVITADFLWQTSSFDALQTRAYVSWWLVPLVVVGGGTRLGGWGLCAWVLTIALAGLAHGDPGVRRAYAALPLLAVPLGIGMSRVAARTPRLAVLLGLGLSAACLLETWDYLQGSASVFPWILEGYDGTLAACTQWFSMHPSP